MSKERSAIEAIYKILDEISEVNKRLDVMDSNIKLLNNKLMKLSSSKNSSGPGGSAGGPSAVAPSASAPIAPIVRTSPSASPVSEIAQTIKVFGRVKNQRKKPIKDVYVKIFSPEGAVLKTRTTDSDGYWEARLPSGTYGVELNASHIHSKFRPININIIIDETMNEYEVK